MDQDFEREWANLEEYLLGLKNRLDLLSAQVDEGARRRTWHECTYYLLGAQVVLSRIWQRVGAHSAGFREAPPR